MKKFTIIAALAIASVLTVSGLPSRLINPQVNAIAPNEVKGSIPILIKHCDLVDLVGWVERSVSPSDDLRYTK